MGYYLLSYYLRAFWLQLSIDGLRYCICRRSSVKIEECLYGGDIWSGKKTRPSFLYLLFLLIYKNEQIVYDNCPKMKNSMEDIRKVLV